jgi:hypothetical protein
MNIGFKGPFNGWLISMPIQLTASKSSGITKKRPRTPDPILFPSDVAYLKELEEIKSIRDSRAKQKQERLRNEGPADLEWRLPANKVSNLVFAMRTILDRMWNQIPEKGLGREGRGNVFQYRQSLPPLVMTTHLYGVFPNNSTYVDREILRVTQRGQIRRLVVNLVEGGELVVESDKYYDILREAVKTQLQNGNEKAADTLQRFKQLLQEMPTSITLTVDDLEPAGLADTGSVLLSMGFLTLQPGRSDTFNISIPNIGSYLKLVSTSRKWVVKGLEKMSWKEQLESVLLDRWESNKTYWREFKGAKLEWVLYDCYGGGWCEAFKTPVGRGWKLTGK